MSNAGQAALIIVGTVVGTYFGYPQLGFVLGSLAGQALFPTQLPAGPRISDNRTTVATIGGPVPIVFGTADVAGTVIWLAPIVQSTKHTSAKGGPQQTTYQYNQSIAIGLCEGPIGTVLRIWENGAIVFDIRPQQLANPDLNQRAETDLAYANRLTVSGTYADTFVLHTGTETQEPDPTIESILGMGNVPAYRGLAYIVYPNRLLQTAQAWRHPTFRFEVTAGGTGDCTTVTKYSNAVLYPWLNGEIQNPLNTNEFRILQADSSAPHYDVSKFSNVYSTLATALADTNAMYAAPYDTMVTYALTNYGGLAPTSLVGGGAAAGGNGGIALGGQYLMPDPGAVELWFSFQTPASIHNTFPAPTDAAVTTPGSKFVSGIYSYEITNTIASDPVPSVPSPWVSVNRNMAAGYPYWWFISSNVCIEVRRAGAAPLPPCTGLPPWVIDPGYAVQHDGTLIRCDSWVLDGSQNYYVLQTEDTSPTGEQDNKIASYPLNPTLPVGDARNTMAFWNAAYAAAVTAGTIAAGKTYNPGGGVNQYPRLQGGAYKIDATVCTGLAAEVTVASIITAVCARAGLLTIDVTDMEAVSVGGYAVSTITSASSIISPLRSVGFFDAIESQGVMKFLARGKAVAATLTVDDLGAYEETGNTVPPPSVQVVRAQPVDLPARIRLKYKCIARDYQDSEQDSEFRLSTLAVNPVDIALPLCLGDVQAAQCAEVIWADAWAASTSYSIALDQSWLALDCGDCIAVPVDGFMQRLRIVSDTTAGGVLRKLSCVRDDSGAYISFAVPSVPQVQPQVLSFVGPTTYELLDLPALSDADSDPGFYVAAQRQSGGGKWNGCLVYQSVDGGITYAELFAVTNEATMGTLNAPVTASEPYTWDMATTITVNVPADFSFESRTDAAVIAGANAAAMGADGRWEVLQFATATQVNPTQWHLTRLLRGRRGTEHVMGSSLTGDAFVILSTGDLVRKVLEQSQIGTALKYKVVSLGAAYSTGIDQTFTGHGQALVPFSPVELAAAIVSGDINLSWIRRGRLGRTLMSGVDIPLSEATEAYQVDILSGSSPETVKRTLSVTTQAATYTAAQQTTDFGAPFDSGDTLTIAVYQISAIVGRGTPAIATLTL